MSFHTGFYTHLVDGTYELFRYHYAPQRRIHEDTSGRDVGATRGVLASMLSLLAEGATHIGVATDHVIESFRNQMWSGYKDGSDIDPVLRGQFALVETGLRAMGITVWPMVAREADDALGSAAHVLAGIPLVKQVIICSPDKDLAQAVRSNRVVQLDRRQKILRDEQGVVSRFGVHPASIPDYLGLVGDGADGFPGLRGWGAKSASRVLACYQHVENIPESADNWEVTLRQAASLAKTLQSHMDLALLFRDLATLRIDPPVLSSLEEIEWRGPSQDFGAFCEALRAPELARRAEKLANTRG